MFRLIIPSTTTDAATAADTTPVVVPKSNGGDEVYVQWEAPDYNDDDHDDDDYMAVAQITDQKDGTYLLKFIRPPMLQYNYTKNRQQKRQQQDMIDGGANNTHQHLNDGEAFSPPQQ